MFQALVLDSPLLVLNVFSLIHTMSARHHLIMSNVIHPGRFHHRFGKLIIMELERGSKMAVLNIIINIGIEFSELLVHAI